MTREKAIDLLDNLNGMIEDSRNSDYDTAFKMAIKALKQEPCEDCISRQAVLDEMYKRRADGDAITVGFIKNLPHVTPLPKGHGRLIDADRLTRAEIMHLWYHLPNGDIACPKVDIDHAPTVIEADKEE